MWLLLGATLALAAFVNHERAARCASSSGRRGRTGRSRCGCRASGRSCRRPTATRALSSAPPSPPNRRAPAGEGRSVTILRDASPTPGGPLEHLLITISQTAAVHGPAEWADATESVEIGNWPGLMVSLEETEKQTKQKQQPPDEEQPDDPRALRPRGQAVVRRLRRAPVAARDRDPAGEHRNERGRRRRGDQADRGGHRSHRPAAARAAGRDGRRSRAAPASPRPTGSHHTTRTSRTASPGSCGAAAVTGAVVDELPARADPRRAAVDPAPDLPVGAPVESPVAAADKLADKSLDEKRAILTAHAHARPAAARPDGERRRPAAVARPLPRTAFSDLFPTAAYVIADEHSDRGFAASAGPRRAVLAVFRARAPSRGSRAPGRLSRAA